MRSVETTVQLLFVHLDVVRGDAIIDDATTDLVGLEARQLEVNHPNVTDSFTARNGLETTASPSAMVRLEAKMDAFVNGQVGIIFEGSVAVGKATGETLFNMHQFLMFCDLSVSIATKRTLANGTLETTGQMMPALVGANQILA